jgi:hypothetical protein
VYPTVDFTNLFDITTNNRNPKAVIKGIAENGRFK